MNKKSLILVIVIFLISLGVIATAFEFDNVKNFDKEAGTSGRGVATIKNWFGLTKLAEVELMKNTDYCIVNCYAEGKITLYSDGKLIQSLRFDTLKGKLINHVVYIKDKGNWIAYDNKELSAGDYEWRLEGEIEAGGKVDWMGTWFGMEVNEWAVWDSNVVAYYTFNETADAVLPDVARASPTGHNGTLTNMADGNWITGKIGNGLLFGGDDNDERVAIDDSYQAWTNTTNFTLSFWLNVSDDNLTQTNALFSFTNETTFFVSIDSGNMRIFQGDTTNDTTIDLRGGWQFYTFTYTYPEGNLTIYENGSVKTSFGIKNQTSSAQFIDYFGSNANAGDEYAGSMDEVGIWNRTLTPDEVSDLWNSGDGLTFGLVENTITVVLDAPENNTQHSGLINFTSTITPTNFNLTNATILIWYANTTIFNITTNIITGNSVNTTAWNIGDFTLGNFDWNVEGCGVLSSDDSFFNCSLVTENRTFTIISETIEQNFSNHTFETARETFNINISIAEGFTPTIPQFNYAGTFEIASLTLISGQNYTLNSSIDIPTTNVDINNTFFFTWLSNGTSENSTFTNQTVFPINLAVCNATFTVPFVNYTFQDEADLNILNSTILTDWDIYLGNGEVNETSDFQDTSENNNYTFCFDPPDRNVNVAGNLLYSASGYPQRRFDFISILSNTTTEKTLFLLATADGVFAQFQIVDSINGTALNDVDVTVQRTISGDLETLATDSSDDAGVVIFFLNPDFEHTFTFIKNGWNTLVQSVTPTSADVFTVFMDSIEGEVITGFNVTEIAENLNYFIFPDIDFLNNHTNYNFGINANNSISINVDVTLENSTNILNTASDSGTALTISMTNNTFDYDFIKGTFNITTANETFIFIKLWSVGDFDVGDFSLWAVLEEWDTQAEGEVIFQWIKVLIMAVVFVGGFFLYSKGGGDLFDSSIIPIAGGLIILWIFSLAGWLEVAFFPDLVIGGYSGWLQKHGIATLITLMGAGFITWRFTSQ